MKFQWHIASKLKWGTAQNFTIVNSKIYPLTNKKTHLSKVSFSDRKVIFCIRILVDSVLDDDNWFFFTPTKKFRWDIPSKNLNFKDDFLFTAFHKLKNACISNLQTIIFSKFSPTIGIKILETFVMSSVNWFPALALMVENNRDRIRGKFQAYISRQPLYTKNTRFKWFFDKPFENFHIPTIYERGWRV